VWQIVFVQLSNINVGLDLVSFQRNGCEPLL